MRLFLVLLLAASAGAQDILVITPDAFRPALKKWQRHREAQGHRIVVRAPVENLRGLVGESIRYVLLLGDTKQVPCTYSAGEIIKPWERDPRIASDNGLADRDGDSLPDLAVGRLPADDVEEAAALLDKVIRYETDADFSTWRRRVNVVAGVGGFGKFQDWALEQVATRFLSQNIPEAYDLHVTYCNPNSPFCPPPSSVAATTVERFNEGALVVTYLGHGSRQGLDSLRFQGRRYPIFDENLAYELKARRGAPIAILIACSSGHVDGAPDCLAEVMLKQPRGPVALIASSRVSMPYANGVLAKELLDALFGERLPTLGDVLKQAKRRLMQPQPGDSGRKLIELLATPYQPDAQKRAQERAEHLFLYNLLGDPTMRIPIPAEAVVECVQVDRSLVVTGRSPVQGEVLVELVSPRTPSRPRRKGDRDKDFREAYERANARTLLSARVAMKAGGFSVRLALSGAVRPGAFVVRVFVHGEKGAALGSTRINLR